MITSMFRIIVLSVMLVLVACSGGSSHDLQEFMDAERAKRGGRIEPLPAFPPYVSVVYSAAGLRSPFEPPRAVIVQRDTGTETAPPDTSRPREYLERINFADLQMVGTILKDGIRWALLSDSQGSVHRVQSGNYIGKNFGRIISVSETALEVVEIVPDGQGGWIERPRNLSMNIQ